MLYCLSGYIFYELAQDALDRTIIKLKQPLESVDAILGRSRRGAWSTVEDERKKVRYSFNLADYFNYR